MFQCILIETNYAKILKYLRITRTLIGVCFCISILLNSVLMLYELTININNSYMNYYCNILSLPMKAFYFVEKKSFIKHKTFLRYLEEYFKLL